MVQAQVGEHRVLADDRSPGCKHREGEVAEGEGGRQEGPDGPGGAAGSLDACSTGAGNHRGEWPVILPGGGLACMSGRNPEGQGEKAAGVQVASDETQAFGTVVDGEEISLCF